MCNCLDTKALVNGGGYYLNVAQTPSGDVIHLEHNSVSGGLYVAITVAVLVATLLGTTSCTCPVAAAASVKAAACDAVAAIAVDMAAAALVVAIAT